MSQLIRVAFHVDLELKSLLFSYFIVCDELLITFHVVSGPRFRVGCEKNELKLYTIVQYIVNSRTCDNLKYA